MGATNSKTPKNETSQETPEITKDFSRICHLEPERSSSAKDTEASRVDISKYDFNIENVAFEGGGAKVFAYLGAIQVLEELGLTVSSGRIKRLVGTSSGAITAMLLAIGFSSSDVKVFMVSDIKKLVKDARVGLPRSVPNINTSYGCNPGNALYDWCGEKLKEKTGNADITFSQLYVMEKIELCVVATNISQMSVVYCHPKTTPDMPIRTAIRMSMAFPVAFAPVKYEYHNTENLFVDGGLICNYPVHAYDGWFLSMKIEDSFLTRICCLERLDSILQNNCRFGTYNRKTIGIILYANNEEVLYRSKLQNRIGTHLHDIPDTKLGKKYKDLDHAEEVHQINYFEIAKVVNKLMQILAKHHVDRNQTITLEEFKAALNNPELSEEEKERLFGENYDAEDTYKLMGNGNTICFQDMLVYLDKIGLDFHNKILGYKSKPIDSFGDYLDSIQLTIATNISQLYMKSYDIKRTIAINTGHIGASDIDLEQKDREFLIHRGRVSTEAFFKYFVVWNHLKPAR